MRKNILVAGLFHESHSFLSKTTNRADFASLHLLVGNELLTNSTINGSPLDAFRVYAKSADWNVIPSSFFAAMPSGKVDHEVVEEFLSILATDIRNNLNTLDAIFFILHGAMVSTKCNDVEGLILSETKKILSQASKQIPVFGVLDLHANLSPSMIENSTCLYAYRKNPHIDAYEASEKLSKILDKTLTYNLKIKQAFVQIPLMLAPIHTSTDAPIMKSILQEISRFEENDPSILCINITPGFSYSDTKDTQLSLSGATIGELNKLEDYLRKLGHLAWELKDAHSYNIQSPKEIIASIKKQNLKGTIVITEPSDNVGGGAPGDGTEGLRALMEAGFTRLAAVICDPEAVATCWGAGLNVSISISIGGKTDNFHGTPLKISGNIIHLSNGQFLLEDKKSHLASLSGEKVDMGNCATIQTDQALILLTTHRTPQMDLGQLRSQKISPEEQFIVLVKAAVAHKKAYDPITKHHFAMETKGLCCSDLTALPFKFIKRPIYPLDKNFSF